MELQKQPPVSIRLAMSSIQIQQTLPLPPCPPSYSVSWPTAMVARRFQQISSRRQTVSTRPPRPPSYEDSTNPEILDSTVGLQSSSSDTRPAAPPPSEAGPSTTSGDSPRPENIQETVLDFPEDYWTSQGDAPDPRTPSSLSLIATCGAPSEHSLHLKTRKKLVLWKTTLSYAAYICAIIALLILYTVFLVLVCRSLNPVTIIMVTVLYLGVGFLIWVCYLVLKAILERLWKE